jgi:hypothetical protein
MNRTAFLTFTLACVVLAAVSCGKGHFPQSNTLFPQLKTLDSHTSVTLKDAWILGSSNQLLRAQFIFEGSDPNQKYDLKAALRANENGEDIKSIYVWCVGLTPPPVVPTNGIEMLWEFKDFPTNTPNIYLREYYMDKATGHMVKSLDFVLPGTQRLRLNLLNN